jgi:diacylglycerol kinase (ATP)
MQARANHDIRGIRRIIRAFAHSFAGYRAAWVNEEAFRQEAMAAAVMIPAGCLLGSTAAERALLIGCCLMVLIVELLNSCVETVVDRVGSEHHELSGRAKDMGSAAVLLSLTTTVLVWGLILWERVAG